MTDNDLKNYVAAALKAHGALVDDSGGGLSVLLPPDLARVLGASEFLQLCFPSEENNPNQSAILVRYGSAILEKIHGLMSGAGLISCSAVDDVYLKKEKLSESLASEFQFIRMKPVWQEAIKETHQYLLVNFAYSAISDDRHDGLAGVMISKHTLASAPAMLEEFGRLLQIKKDSLPPPEKQTPLLLPELPIESALETAAIHVKEKIEFGLREFIVSLKRRKERDIKRISEYYGNLRQEIEKYIFRRNLQGEDLKKQQLKLRAVSRELDYKMNDLEGKYSINIELRVVSVMQISLPILVNKIRVLKGKAERELFLAWNPLTKSFDPLICQSCKKQIYTISSCDAQHWLCNNCASPCRQCGKKFCPVCISACPACGAKK